MKVSVIVPVYNVADKISVCLDSLCAQDLDGVQVILVDDHGTDNSMDVVRAYADAHPEMSFVFADNGKNKGPGAARNLGLKYAVGEFVAFVDSDDRIEPDFCSSLYNAAVSVGAQMAYCHISMDYPDGRCEIKKNPIVPDGEFDRHRFLSRYRSYFTTFIYSRLFLQESGIGFPETHSAEDSCFLLCSLLSCSRIASVDRPMYHYIIEQTSVSKRKDRHRWKNRMRSFRTARRFAKDHGLYRRNFLIVEWLCFKKGFLLSLKDLLNNL